MNHETDRLRLAQLYAAKSDEELSELLTEKGLLTDAARLALAEECARRGIEFGESSASAAAEESSLPKYSGPLVIVKRFRDLPEAFVAKSMLDSAGIDNFLADENLVRIDWLYLNLIGGAKLMVRPEDLPEAAELLNQQAKTDLTADKLSESTSNKLGESGE